MPKWSTQPLPHMWGSQMLSPTSWGPSLPNPTSAPRRISHSTWIWVGVEQVEVTEHHGADRDMLWGSSSLSSSHCTVGLVASCCRAHCAAQWLVILCGLQTSCGCHAVGKPQLLNTNTAPQKLLLLNAFYLLTKVRGLGVGVDLLEVQGIC